MLIGGFFAYQNPSTTWEVTKDVGDWTWSLAKKGLSKFIKEIEGVERPSPEDRINEDQIKVYDDKVVLEVPGTTWAKYTNTHSMDPVLDEGYNGIEIKPESEDDIVVGDVISYTNKDKSRDTVHRVVKIGEDKHGKYFITKGDNVKVNDPNPVRYEQINGILVAVVY